MLTLIVGLVTVLHAEVEVLDVKVDIGENQLTDRPKKKCGKDGEYVCMHRSTFCYLILILSKHNPTIIVTNTRNCSQSCSRFLVAHGYGICEKPKGEDQKKKIKQP